MKMLPDIYRMPLYAANLKRAIAFEKEKEREREREREEKEKEEKERDREREREEKEKEGKEKERGKPAMERKVGNYSFFQFHSENIFIFLSQKTVLHSGLKRRSFREKDYEIAGERRGNRI